MTPTTPLLLELELPSPPKPAGSYSPILRDGLWLMTSGILPVQDGVVAYTGPASEDQISGGQAALS